MNTKQTVRVSSLVLMTVLSGLVGGCERHDHRREGQASAGHKHESAHGGVAVELGDHQFHLDFVAEPATGVLKAWVMDAHADSFVRVTNLTWVVRIATPAGEKDLEVQAQANATTGEMVGDSSQFEGRADWLKGVERFTAVVPSIELRGTRFENVRFDYPAH